MDMDTARNAYYTPKEAGMIAWLLMLLYRLWDWIMGIDPLHEFMTEEELYETQND